MGKSSTCSSATRTITRVCRGRTRSTRRATSRPPASAVSRTAGSMRWSHCLDLALDRPLVGVHARAMGIVEERNQPQVYFCMKCGGPGTCVLKQTGQRFCIKCAQSLPNSQAISRSRTRKHRRPGTIGHCWICGALDNVTKHHSKPMIAGHKKEGPVWLLCCPCHENLHRIFRNKTLRVLSIAEIRSALRETRFGIGT